MLSMNTKEIFTRGQKYAIKLYFDPSCVENYQSATGIEMDSFNKIFENPTFCRNENDCGIKKIKYNPPKCLVTFVDKSNNVTSVEAVIKYEMKIKGKSKEGRIGLCEVNINQEESQTFLVATNYFKKGLHSSKDLKKVYNATIRHTGFFSKSTSSSKGTYEHKKSPLKAKRI